MTDRRTRGVLIIAAAVIVLIVVALSFYLLGRSNTATPSPAPTTASPTTTTSTTPSPTYEPTDQSGSPESGLARGAAQAGLGGTSTGPDGLPLGYSHDEAGAVTAATNYLMWMNSLRIADKTLAHSLADASAADDKTKRALIESFDTQRPGLTDLSADQPEPARGAYAVADYDDTRALIYVWSPEVTADSTGRTDHLWGIDAVSVVWADGDWKLDGGLVTMTGAAALDPTDPAGNPSPEEKHSILTRTPADPGEITDSADQAWFEYANAAR